MTCWHPQCFLTDTVSPDVAAMLGREEMAMEREGGRRQGEGIIPFYLTENKIIYYPPMQPGVLNHTSLFCKWAKNGVKGHVPWHFCIPYDLIFQCAVWILCVYKSMVWVKISSFFRMFLFKVCFSVSNNKLLNIFRQNTGRYNVKAVKFLKVVQESVSQCCHLIPTSL